MYNYKNKQKNLNIKNLPKIRQHNFLKKGDL